MTANTRNARTNHCFSLARLVEARVAALEPVLAREGSVGDRLRRRADALDERLVELLYRDITPEDYDFLLKLDESNAKKTLKDKHVLERIPVLSNADLGLDEGGKKVANEVLGKYCGS